MDFGDDDEYEKYLAFFNGDDTDYNDTGDESYVVTGLVTLCDKADVNHFGARFIPVFYYANFLLSLAGNGLVLWILYRYEKLTTATNVFLLNLVLSDLLFASSLPFWAAYHGSEWTFGAAMCKVVGSVYSVGFYSSILFLTLMTFDRYLAVVHAVAAARSRRTLYAGLSSAVVWVVSLLASAKELVLYDVWEHETLGVMCEERGYSKETMDRWHLFGFYQQFLVFFLLPLVMVVYCYARITVTVMRTRMTEKCRAVKLIFVIIFTFFVCWTPYNVVILLRALKIQGGGGGGSEPCSDTLDYALYVTRNIAYLYCCVSPVFYTFVGKKFQSHFRKLLAKHVPCLKDKILLTTTHSTRSTSYRSPHTLNDY